MFCKNCGLKMPKGDKYCRECGTENKILPEDKKKINTRWLTWIMGIIIIICIIMIGIICQQSHTWRLIWVYFLQIVNGLGGNLGNQ